MITSFYSFKGGVGRSVAVAHVAHLLAASRPGGDVLVIDLDLEAPGLDAWFPFPRLARCEGFAGLLRDYRGQPAPRRRAWLARALTQRRYVVSQRGRADALSNLHYLPTGLAPGDASRPAYGTVTGWVREAIRDQDRSTGWPVVANRGFLADLRQALRDRFTWVLIDSRTGLADESFVSTVLLADALVLCFRLNQANLDGIREAYANFLLREGLEPGDPRVPVIPVVTPLPSRGGRDLHDWLTERVWPLFARRRPETDLAAAEAPLSVFSPVVRLYEEPFLEVGERLLLDARGRWRTGFDEGVPLVQGYLALTERLGALNWKADPVGARQLEGRLLDRGLRQAAFEVWAGRAVLDLEAFDDLGRHEASAERLLRAAGVLREHEARRRDQGATSDDDLALAWLALAELDRGRTGDDWATRARDWAQTHEVAAAVAVARAGEILERGRDRRDDLHVVAEELGDAIDGLDADESLRDVALAARAEVLLRMRRYAEAGDALAIRSGPLADSGTRATIASLTAALGRPDLSLRVRLTEAHPRWQVCAVYALRLGWHVTARGCLDAWRRERPNARERLGLAGVYLGVGEVEAAWDVLGAVPWPASDPSHWAVLAALADVLGAGATPVDDVATTLAGLAGSHPRAAAFARLHALFFERDAEPPVPEEWHTLASRWDASYLVALGWLAGESELADEVLTRRLLEVDSLAGGPLRVVITAALHLASVEAEAQASELAEALGTVALAAPVGLAFAARFPGIVLLCRIAARDHLASRSAAAARVLEVLGQAALPAAPEELDLATLPAAELRRAEEALSVLQAGIVSALGARSVP